MSNILHYFFYLYWSPSLSLCLVFYSISSNIDDVLSVNPSAKVFVFGYFNIYHKDCLTPPLVEMLFIVIFYCLCGYAACSNWLFIIFLSVIFYIEMRL